MNADSLSEWVFSAIELIIVVLSLLLIFMPATRTAATRVGLLVLYNVNFTRWIADMRRAGFLTSTPARIARSIRAAGYRSGPLDLLAAILGAIAIVMVLAP
ncbi:MAG: hypothetical protein KGL78_14220 [Burkholderiales bacterium]|nr:hypothetical protein [Burkholderiales bacterium]